MRLIVVIDDDNGMMFNRRRQSQDAVLREHVLQMAETSDTILWMNEYTKGQFDVITNRIQCSEEPLNNAKPGEYCFIENLNPGLFEDKIEELIVFHWNRRYPSDLKFGLELSKWKLVESSEFEGKSHDRITKEIYTK